MKKKTTTTKAAEVSAAAANPARTEILALQKELESRFVKRDEVIEGILIAAVAGLNAVQLGAPGTAKTALAHAIARGFGVSEEDHFAVLLTRFTAPEELFGPVSFSSLKADKYERQTLGYLPSARSAFLDEVFKASPAILNSLLTALNERRFRNGAAWVDMPLAFVLAASNEYPEGPHLQALWDRFQVRFWLDYVSTPDERTAVRRARGDREMPALSSLASLEIARREAAAVDVPARLDATFNTLFAAVETATKTPISDRKLVQCERLAKAAAWLRGSDTVEPCDLAVLRHVLWDHHDQAAAVTTEVLKVAASARADAERIAKAIGGLMAPLLLLDAASFTNDADRESAKQRLISVAEEAKRAVERLQKLDAKSSLDKEAIDAHVAEINTKLTEMRGTYAKLAFL